MGKQRRTKRERRDAAPIRPPRAVARSHWKTIASVIGAVMTTFVTALALWLDIRPKIEVAVESALDPRDPFTSRFIVSNAGSILDVENASISCYFHAMEYEKGGRMAGGFTTIWNPVIGTLETDDSTTGTCWPAISTNDPRYGDKLSSADISIFVDYRVGKWPGRVTKEARFVTVKDAAGNLLWTPRATTN